MKHLIVVGDGMADYPMESLGGMTPLMKARTPFMDWMVKHGEIGLVKTVPDGYIPGSEIANLSILGYDPHLYYRGRGPLEAASLGIRLQPDDIAFRCNLVTLKQEGNRTFMEDFSAGHISDEEARQILLDLDHELGTEEIRFYTGVSYRHVMVWRNGALQHSTLDQISLTPPHDIIGKEIGPFLPGGDETSRSEDRGQEVADRILDPDEPVPLLPEESSGQSFTRREGAAARKFHLAVGTGTGSPDGFSEEAIRDRWVRHLCRPSPERNRRLRRARSGRGARSHRIL